MDGAFLQNGMTVLRTIMNVLAEVIAPEEMLIPSLLEMLNHGEWHCRPVVPNKVCHADRLCVSPSGL
jgi:hypothetical protein